MNMVNFLFKKCLMISAFSVVPLYCDDMLIEWAAKGNYQFVYAQILNDGMKPRTPGKRFEIVNQANRDGVTPLIAVFMQRCFFIRGLEERRVVALELDASSVLNICKVLIQEGADPNTVDNRGRSALVWVFAFLARYKGSTFTLFSVVELLLSSGADVHAVDPETRKSIYDYALERGDAKVISLLEQYGARSSTHQEPGLEQSEASGAAQLSSERADGGRVESYEALQERIVQLESQGAESQNQRVSLETQVAELTAQIAALRVTVEEQGLHIRALLDMSLPRS